MKPPRDFSGIFRTDEIARALYAEGAGIARVLPTAVAVPESPDAVSALVRWAQASKIPLVPRGSGSGMAGGAVGSGVVVDLSRLRHIGPVDFERRRVVVGPGALREEVNRRAGDHGLRFPVDPSSGAFATVGGMAATNAGGAHSLRLGSTRAWVTALDCVFDDGARAVARRNGGAPTGVSAVARFARDGESAAREVGARLRDRARVRKNSSGYALAEYATSGDLSDLLVGSEGTLALFVGLELALAPAPLATSSLLALYDTLEGAVAGAAACRELGASACELLDRTFLDVARQGDADVPAAECALLVEVEASSAREAAAAAEMLRAAVAAAGAFSVRIALDAAAERVLWELRHAASPILSRLDPALKSMQFIEDGAVPPERLPEYVRGVREALGRRAIRGIIFGHAGDGHVHVNPLVDVRREGWRQSVEEVLAEVAELTARLGGTLAGEHGDGRIRTPLLSRTWGPEAVEAFALVKRSFDPDGILNPGVKVPLPGQRAIEEMKYDPAAPPLPPMVRAALDAVDRDRAWHRFRLSLVDRPD